MRGFQWKSLPESTESVNSDSYVVRASNLRTCLKIVVGTLRVPQLSNDAGRFGGRHRDCACYFEFSNTF